MLPGRGRYPIIVALAMCGASALAAPALAGPADATLPRAAGAEQSTPSATGPWAARLVGATRDSAALPEVMAQVPGVLIVCTQLTTGVATATTFSFTTPPGGPAIPSITVPANTTAATCTPGVPAAPGTIAVTEQVPAGFTLQSVTGGTLAGATATAPIVPGQPTTLTFINAPTAAGGPGLTVNQTASPPAASVGNPLTYLVTITNTSGTTATGVTVADTLPANVVFNSATATIGSCNGGPGAPTVTCAIGTLTPGGSATVTIRVVPTPAAGGAPLVNTVTASGAGLPAVTTT